VATALPTIDRPKALKGSWLYLAKGFWLFTAALMLAVFVVACIHVYQFYLTPCTTWTIDSSCERVVDYLAAQGFGVRWLALINLFTVVLVGLPWMLVAHLIFAQRGTELSGWILSLALLTGWASDLTNINVRHHVWWALENIGVPLGYLPHALIYFVSFLSQGTIIMLGFLLPNGRFTPSWTRYFILAWLVYMLFETLYRYPFLEAPAWFVYPETVFTFAAPLLAVFAMWYRHRKLNRDSSADRHVTAADLKLQGERRQLETILPSVVTLTVTYTILTILLFLLWRQTLPWLDNTVLRYSHDLLQNILQAACSVWFIFALGVAMFRHKLFALELLINRTLVYGGVSLVLLTLYLLIVFGVGFVFHLQQTFWVSLLATSLIALLFQPLREDLQGRVNHWLFGQRDEPFEVMRQVGQQVQSLHPQDLLPALVQTLHHTLRLPYVAVTLYKSMFKEGSRTVSEGTPGKQVLRFALVAQDDLGVLEVSPRSYETFSPNEEKLLGMIAKEIAVAVRSMHLSLDLQASRERLVTTREEERRRLRRDLHDGLGPTLAAQTLKIGAARSLLRDQPAQADIILQGLEDEIGGTLGYVRQLVYSLRPPLLDQFGLRGALKHQLGEQLQGHQLRLNLVIAELPLLTAAVEVASYFIVTEAFHNVLRHAQATTCDIRISLLEAEMPKLELLIHDDGQGLDLGKTGRDGVGLSSMRERCEELGGVLEISQQRGVTIRAVLPLHLPAVPTLAKREASA
jgi:signal transduction histidine kinase